MLRVALLALLLVAPAASAAALDVRAPRAIEAAATPGASATVDVPIVVAEDGALYAKVLPVEENAVNSGDGPNGTWRVAFALVRADGAVEELGDRATSTPTSLASVRAGEALTLRVRVDVPAEASGAQRVVLAVAHRAAQASAAGGSGATMDEARALTLVLAVGAPLILPVEEDALPDVGFLDEAPRDASSPPSPIVIVQALPTWFLVGALVVGATIAALLGAILVVLARAPRGRIVPVESAPREVPVKAEEREVAARRDE